MGQTLELIIRARDYASAEIAKVGGSIKSITQAMELGGAAALAYLATLKKIAGMVREYVDLGVAVGDFADKTGVATEEASALIDLAQDFQVPLGTLEMAFRTMAKHGIEPSIEGLIQVRTRLDETKDPAERLALATKLLGRAGADLLPILAQLNNDQLRALVANLSEAEKWTSAEVEKVRALNTELVAYDDAVAALKISFSEWAIGASDLTEKMAMLNEVLSGQKGYFQALVDYWTQRFVPNLGGVAEAGFRAALGLDALTESADAGVAGTEALDASLEALDGKVVETTIITNEITVSGGGGGGGGYGMPFGGAGDTERVYDKALGKWYTHNKVTGTYTPGAQGASFGGGGSFMVGEHGAERVTLGPGGGTVNPANDQLAQAINRMVRTLPTILRDAIEKAK